MIGFSWRGAAELALAGMLALGGVARPVWAQGAVVAGPEVAGLKLDQALVEDLVAANRILVAQGVLDGFGHVSVRDKADPKRFWMSRSMAPGLVTAEDLIAFDLDSKPLNARGRGVPLERFIHGAAYAARPDVMAVVHSHAPDLIPFGVTKTQLKPIYHMDSFLAGGVPVFDIARAAGPGSDMLISTPELGTALAQSLGGAAVVLMRGHGATVVGASLPQTVFRAVYTVTGARLQWQAQMMGEVTYLSDAEAAAATKTNNVALNKAWVLWKQEAMRGPP